MNAPRLQLLSHAFVGEATIPPKHTCEGSNTSPPLAWRGVPEQAKSLVLLCDDPDAPGGSYNHWVLYDIPPERDYLPEAFSTDDWEGWGTEGKNDFGNERYDGPCPPRGPAHRYFFRLYAVDTKLNLPPGAARAEVVSRLDGHVLATAELMGTYGRK